MKLILIALLMASLGLNAQSVQNFSITNSSMFATAPFQPYFSQKSHRKLYQRNTGMIIGLQRGKYTSLELGGEAHWRKISLLTPHIIGATANLSYNPGRNVLGYHTGVWMKRGHINLTYGADVNYFTDFNNRQAIAVGPSVGFRFFGFDLVNGFNFVSSTSGKTTEAPLPVNHLYMSIRYYFPVKNEFTWDRQTMKKKRERQRERMKRKRQRQKDNTNKKFRLKLPFSKS